MKAFLSYSLTDDDRFVVPLVAQNLQEVGFFVANGYLKPVGTASDIIDLHTVNEINTSSLFIGIVTSTGLSNEEVYHEWQYSTGRNIPSFLLIEDTCPPIQKLEHNNNVVPFNRARPKETIDRLETQRQRYGELARKPSAEAWLLLVGLTTLMKLVTLLCQD